MRFTRYLKIVVSFIGLCGGVVVALYCNFRAQATQTLRSHVESAGGTVQVESVLPKWIPNQLRNLSLFTRVTEVHIESFHTVDESLDAISDEYWINSNAPPPRINNSLIRRVSNSPSIRVILFDGAAIDDRLIEQLGQMPNVTVLSIAATQCTEHSIDMLQSWTRLSRLRCAFIEIDDSSIPALQRLQSITHLDLSYTKVTEDGLKQIATSPKLKELRIIGVNVSDETIEAIRQTRPALSLVLQHEVQDSTKSLAQQGGELDTDKRRVSGP